MWKINGKIYDLTNFLDKHPGGRAILLACQGDDDLTDTFEDKYSVLDNVDALVLVTEWKEFRSPDFDYIKQKMKGNLMIDGRNQFDAKYMKGKGFKYIQIGVA